MRKHGVQAMLCPYIDCLGKRNSDNGKSFFHHLVIHGFTQNYMCWNKHDEKGLNELEAGCLNEGEVRHHATQCDET
jgi:hypothetical protein